MHNPMQFELLGRVDDILNIGGIKVSAGRLEDRVMEDARIADAGVAYVVDDRGRGAVVLALVPPEGIDIGPLTQEAVKRMALGATPVQVVAVPAIPRTETGKVRRNALSDTVHQSLKASVTTNA